MHPPVSVIIPAYNDPEGIVRTLEALNVQTMPKGEFEIVVADNASSDDTPGQVERYQAAHPDLNIRLIRVPKPGSYAARNAAVAESRGQLLAFTDSECIPVPEWLESGCKMLKETGCGYVVGPIFFEFKRKQPLVAELIDSKQFLWQEVYVLDGWGATANVFATREAYDKAGPFREDMYSGADRVFGAQMVKAGYRAMLAEKAIVKHPARSTWSSIRKKKRRIAVGAAQRTFTEAEKLVNEIQNPHGRSASRIQQIPRPTLIQLPGFHLLRLLCRLDYNRSYSEVIRNGGKVPTSRRA